ncbi:MAG: hypothetical protein JWO81_137 [Alphaproteobacteria bacterium]|nr:hypothetical protein [Alphaproteobacteria bacterium]
MAEVPTIALEGLNDAQKNGPVFPSHPNYESSHPTNPKHGVRRDSNRFLYNVSQRTSR